MDVGVSLPMRSYSGRELREFARVAEEGPFASVTVGERVANDNHDALSALAVLAGMTERIRLVTGVLVLPIHDPVTLAKRAATVDVLSEGRLVLGLGVGPREPDFAVTRSSWGDRGRRFEQQLATMHRVWRGESPYEGTDVVGPTLADGRPEVIIGGFADVALRRAGRLADGVRSFDFAPDVELHRQRYAIVRQAWDDAGRGPGRPRLIASTYFSLGPDARDVYEAGMREYYGYDDDTQQWSMTDTALTSPSAIRDAVKRFEDAGVDEMVFATALHLGPDSWSRLADAIG